jgi:hypothetical protein
MGRSNIGLSAANSRNATDVETAVNIPSAHSTASSTAAEDSQTVSTPAIKPNQRSPNANSQTIVTSHGRKIVPPQKLRDYVTNGKH